MQLKRNKIQEVKIISENEEKNDWQQLITSTIKFFAKSYLIFYHLLFCLALQQIYYRKGSEI